MQKTKQEAGTFTSGNGLIYNPLSLLPTSNKAWLVSPEQRESVFRLFALK